MRLELVDHPVLLGAGGLFSGLVSVATTVALTSLSPIHGLIYGVAFGVLGTASLNSSNVASDSLSHKLAKRVIELSTAALITAGLVNLAGIPISLGTAALLSGMTITAGLVVMCIGIYFKDRKHAHVS